MKKNIYELSGRLNHFLHEWFYESKENVVSAFNPGHTADITPDFSAILVAVHEFYLELTGRNDVDLIDFSHLLNSLAIQVLFDADEEDCGHEGCSD